MYSLRVRFRFNDYAAVIINMTQSRGLAQGVAALFNGVRSRSLVFMWRHSILLARHGTWRTRWGSCE